MPEHRWLILRLEAPLLAFGGIAVDQLGVIRDFPATSMLTGLLGNALGWCRTQVDAHQDLQDRLVFAARRDRRDRSGVLTDNQNAQLAKNDRGWTTRGEPEGRDGASYNAPHRRRREYHADALVTVALRLSESERGPDLNSIADALDRPARPLFIGRKPCLPSAPLRVPEPVEAPTAYAALQRAPIELSEDESSPLALWPFGDGPAEGDNVRRIFDLADLRNWRTGLHGGTRRVVEGYVDPLDPQRVAA